MSGGTTDHLANERTFLAWIRTALSLIGLGFVLARMGLFLRQIAAGMTGDGTYHGRAGVEFLWVGVIFLVIGTGLAGMSWWLHDRNRRAIEAGAYTPARGMVLMVAAVVVVGGLAIAGLLVWRTTAGLG